MKGNAAAGIEIPYIQNLYAVMLYTEVPKYCTG